MKPAVICTPCLKMASVKLKRGEGKTANEVSDSCDLGQTDRDGRRAVLLVLKDMPFTN